MMAHDLARCLDPALLAVDCGITPDQWQRDLLRSTSHRVLMLCARQTGKSTVAAIIAIGTALYRPASLSLILSPSQRQSAEALRCISMLHARLRGVPDLRSDTVLKAEFTNGSRIIALPGSADGKTIRGYAGANLLVLDEAARVEDSLIAAVRPMLATSNGKLIALTTPAGKRGWFHQAWESGGTDWLRVKVFAEDCPRISQAFLDEELRALGPQRYSEEYGLQFLDSDEAVFPLAVIQRAFTSEVQPLWH
jgi:hypothetical protein